MAAELSAAGFSLAIAIAIAIAIPHSIFSCMFIAKRCELYYKYAPLFPSQSKQYNSALQQGSDNQQLVT